MDCVLKAVEEMIEKMKEEIAKKQSIAYPEQIVVAEIYDIVSRILCEACKKEGGMKDCKPKEMRKGYEVGMDALILLKQLKEDGFISESYYEKILKGLVKINPELEEKVKEEREKGFL